MKVYGMVPFDRSGRVRWLLHELGIPFEDVWLSWKEGHLSTPEFRAMSPMGRVPVLVDGDVTLAETGAILGYLSETYGTGSFSPSSHDSSAWLQWSMMLAASIDPLCFEFVRPDIPAVDRDSRREKAARDFERAVVPALSSVLGARDTFLPGGMSALDIQAASVLAYAARRGHLSSRPRLAGYLEAMQSRPAAQASGMFG